VPAATFSSDYVTTLTEEIERLVQALPARQTTYRGVDLRYALQRALYFRYANEEALRTRWRAAPPPAGWLATRVGLELRARTPKAIALAAPRVARDLRLERAFRREARPEKGQLAFAIIHSKFARYAQAIGLDGLDAVFYCGTLAELHAELRNGAIPALLSPSLSPWRRLVALRQPYLEAFGLQRELDAHLGFLEHARPRAVVVVEGNAPSDEVINQACKLLGIPCICIQQGWSPIIHAAFRGFSFSKMLVWGDEFARLLAPYNPQQRFVATGSHVIGPEGPVAHGARRDAISFFLQARSPMIDDAVWDGFLALLHAVARRCSARPILAREHPSAPLDEATRSRLRQLSNVELVDPRQVSLHDQLVRSRIAVSLFSTTLFESAAAGVVPVAVNPRVLRTFVPSLGAAGVGVEPTSWAEAESAIVQLSEDDDLLAQHVAACASFTGAFFHGATREQAKAALRAELPVR
jgi:hypothetical protein